MKWNKEVKEEVKMWQGNEFDIKEDTPTHVLMEKNAGLIGHVVVFLLTFWTFGIGNLIWYVIGKKQHKVMK